MIWCRIRKLIGPTALVLALISTPAFADPCLPTPADAPKQEPTPEEIAEENQSSYWRAADAVYLARLEKADWDDLEGSPVAMGSERTYVRIPETPLLKGRAAPDRVTTKTIVCASGESDPFTSERNAKAYEREESTFIVFATRNRVGWDIGYAIAPEEAVYEPLIRRLERVGPAQSGAAVTDIQGLLASLPPALWVGIAIVAILAFLLAIAARRAPSVLGASVLIRISEPQDFQDQNGTSSLSGTIEGQARGRGHVEVRLHQSVLIGRALVDLIRLAPSNKGDRVAERLAEGVTVDILDRSGRLIARGTVRNGGPAPTRSHSGVVFHLMGRPSANPNALWVENAEFVDCEAVVAAICDALGTKVERSVVYPHDAIWRFGGPYEGVFLSWDGQFLEIGKAKGRNADLDLIAQALVRSGRFAV